MKSFEEPTKKKGTQFKYHTFTFTAWLVGLGKWPKAHHTVYSQGRAEPCVNKPAMLHTKCAAIPFERSLPNRASRLVNSQKQPALCFTRQGPWTNTIPAAQCQWPR